MQPKNPAPLLIVIASYDANGNGINDYDPAHPELLNDKTSPVFGEQWALTTPEDCYENFFGETGYSMLNYYKEMTNGKFWFYPAHIDHPQKENALEGILEITVPMPHPAALRNLEGYNNVLAARKAIHDIVKACDPYVDFAKYDLNGDGIVTPDELAIIILNAGYENSSTKPDLEYSTVREENGPIPSHRYMVHGTSQNTDVEMRGGVRIVKVSNTGEMNAVGPMPIGTPAHELAHNLGAQDMYCRFTPPDDRVFGWPIPNQFSLMSRGNNRGKGRMPTYIDPYQRIYLGFSEEEIAETDGIYTLYSTMSGKYKALKIPTVNPDEYILAEVRLKEGFESELTDGDAKGGVVFWHIDEKVNSEWFMKAQCVSSNRPNGNPRHDLGNAVRLRNTFEEITDENGNLVKYGPLFKMEKNVAEDPFFYKSNDPKTAIYDSSMFCGAASGSYGLNHFPEGVSEDWKLVVEVLDEPGAEMRIKITRG